MIFAAPESSPGRGSSIIALRRRERIRLCCASARDELREIESVATRYASRYAVVPLLKDEPVGVERIMELTEHVTESV
jgi:hypothetical protein